MSVTAAVSKGIRVIVCVAGSSDSDMPLTVRPVFPVDPVSVWVGVGVSTDVGVVGDAESPPPQPATVPTRSCTATTSTAYFRIFRTEQDTEKDRRVKSCPRYPFHKLIDQIASLLSVELFSLKSELIS